MTHNIIKTENYLLVVDDSKIKQNDWFYLNDANIIAEYISVKPVNEAKKITAHLPLNNSPVLEFVPLLPPLEDEVEKKDSIVRRVIKSLQQPKMPIAFECEWTTKQMPEFHQDEPKTTTNPQGQTVLVGKYIY